MTRPTPAVNRWPSHTIDEERPLLPVDDEVPSFGPSARAVISKKTNTRWFPIDHGWLPWLQVVAGWVLSANSWGLPSAYGTFQTSAQFRSSFAYLDVFRPVSFWTAAIFRALSQWVLLEVIGLLATSFSTGYWQTLLAQGVLASTGCDLLGLLPVAVISMYFEEKRMIAAGLAAPGASFAGILQSIVLKYLFEGIGFLWAVRLLAAAILLSSVFPFFVMRLQSEGAEGRSRFSLNHFKDPTYSAFICAFTFIQAAAMVPIFFIQEYALALGIDETMTVHLLAILNMVALFGRFVPNVIADRYGGINTLVPLTLACIILLATLPLFSTLPSLIVFCILYGFASGGALILPAPIITRLCPNAADLGVRMGLGYLLAAFGGLVGNLLSGAAKREGDPSAVREFRRVWWVAAGIMSLAFAALLVTRWLKAGSIFLEGRF